MQIQHPSLWVTPSCVAWLTYWREEMSSLETQTELESWAHDHIMKLNQILHLGQGNLPLSWEVCFRPWHPSGGRNCSSNLNPSCHNLRLFCLVLSPAAWETRLIMSVLHHPGGAHSSTGLQLTPELLELITMERQVLQVFWLVPNPGGWAGGKGNILAHLPPIPASPTAHLTAHRKRTLARKQEGRTLSKSTVQVKQWWQMLLWDRGE